MALALYEYTKSTNTFDAISVGTQVNPVTTNHNGVDGQTVVKKLFVRNDDLTKWYDAISITPTSSPDDLVSANNIFGWSVKLLGGDTEPSAADWTAQTSGAALTSVADIGTASPRRHFLPEIGQAGAGDDNYYPFWMQITVPKGTRQTVELGVSLTLLDNENVV